MAIPSFPGGTVATYATRARTRGWAWVSGLETAAVGDMAASPKREIQTMAPTGLYSRYTPLTNTVYTAQDGAAKWRGS
jgi:hypothetical protein